MCILINSILVLLLCINSTLAQNASLNELLQTIETNNKSLAAYRSHMKSEHLQFKSTNKLPDLQVSAYFLPFGEHNTANYTEYEITQQFEFPSVYAARGNWIDEQQKKLELEYRKLKQEVLLEAKKLWLEWVYIQKRKELMQERILQSEKVYDQVKSLHNEKQKGMTTLSKARIVWLDQQFAIEELNTQEEQVKQDLQALNGDNEIRIQISTYPNAIEISEPDSLWIQWLNRSVQIAMLKQNKQITQQRLKVERNQLLPDLTAGYNHQGVAGNNYSGFYGGLSIPLWRGRNKIKMVEAQSNYYKHRQSELISSLKNTFESSVQRYQLLIEKYRDYQKAMDGLNSELLLQQSFEEGELSFTDYYGEVSFYRDAENRMLEMEKELHQIRAELFQHQL